MPHNTFNTWLESLPQTGGTFQISKVRPYAHAEEQYDAQYGVTTPHPEEGLGLCAVLQKLAVDTGGPAIEIGCGTGHLTTGLALAYPGPAVLITDPSAVFLKLTRDRLEASGQGPARQHYGILNADDLSLLPAGTFSLITLRSTLHHILNVEEFIGSAARALRPGGALAMGAEPCESGYVLMGSVAQSIPATLQAAGVTLTPAQREKVQLFADTMKFYCRRDLDKSTAEDKHLFRVHELASLGAQHGLHLQYFPNAAYADFVDETNAGKSRVCFSRFFLSYARYCMSFDVELVELIATHAKTHLDYLDDCYRSHPGPLFTGVFVLGKKKMGNQPE